MKSLPANLIIEKNKTSSKYAWLVCVEITLKSGTVLRLVRNYEDVAIREDDYVKAGCVGHWKLNDDAADTTVVDSSHNSNDGAAQQNTEDVTTTGKIGGALSFDGSSDYITVSDPAGGELDFGSSGDFSISAWCRSDGTGVNQRIVSKGNYWVMITAGDVFQAGLTDGVDAQVAVGGSSDMCDGEWHHIVGTFDRDGVLTVYLDGTVEGTPADISGEGDIDNSYDLHIGSHVTPSDYFNGDIDNVAIFNRVLAAKEVQYLYNAGNGTETNPRLYTAFPLMIEPKKSNARGEIPSVNLQACNVTRLIQPYLEAEGGGIGAQVKISVVNSGYKVEDYAELTETFEIIETQANWDWVSFTLGAPNPLRQRFPKYRYYAGACRWRFRNSDDDVTVECGYTPKDIEGITLPSGSEVSIEITSHGFSTGDVVYFLSVGGTTELNANSYTITKTDADNFTLDGTDGDDFTAYTSGGTCGYYECPRTLAGCAARGNLARYGGFYGMAAGGVRIV